MTTALQSPASETVSREKGRAGVRYTPRFDIVETAEELTLYGDLPGVQPADLEVRFENQELVIHGRVAARNDAGDRNNAATGHWEREYGVGDFYRTFAVSEGIDAQRIQAELKNGVLTLHLPKAEAVKPRKIQVNGQ
jgi:HSP20 family protein